MKTILICAVTTAPFVGAAVAEPAPLDVTIEGVEARGGTLYVSVQTEDAFMGTASTAGAEVEGPEAGVLTETLMVEPGDYAVSVWHDDDANGAFDMGAMGIPQDGWALSGGPLSGPPSFEDAKVTVEADGGEATLRMTYGR